MQVEENPEDIQKNSPEKASLQKNNDPQTPKQEQEVLQPKNSAVSSSLDKKRITPRQSTPMKNPLAHKTSVSDPTEKIQREIIQNDPSQAANLQQSKQQQSGSSKMQQEAEPIIEAVPAEEQSACKSLGKGLLVSKVRDLDEPMKIQEQENQEEEQQEQQQDEQEVQVVDNNKMQEEQDEQITVRNSKKYSMKKTNCSPIRINTTPKRNSQSVDHKDQGSQQSKKSNKSNKSRKSLRSVSQTAQKSQGSQEDQLLQSSDLQEKKSLIIKEKVSSQKGSQEIKVSSQKSSQKKESVTDSEEEVEGEMKPKKQGEEEQNCDSFNSQRSIQKKKGSYEQKPHLRSAMKKAEFKSSQNKRKMLEFQSEDDLDKRKVEEEQRENEGQEGKMSEEGQENQGSKAKAQTSVKKSKQKGNIQAKVVSEKKALHSKYTTLEVEIEKKTVLLEVLKQSLRKENVLPSASKMKSVKKSVKKSMRKQVDSQQDLSSSTKKENQAVEKLLVESDRKVQEEECMIDQ